MLPPVDVIVTFCAICAHCDASVSGLARERRRWHRQLGSYCPFVPGTMPMAPWHYGTSPKLNSSQNSWGSGCWSAQSPSLACIWQTVTEHLTFTAYALRSPSAFRPRGRANQPPSHPPRVSLSFHLLFLFHNVKLLRLQILTGNVSLQTERVSITCLMFH